MQVIKTLSTSTAVISNLSASDNYYSGIDYNATNTAMKVQLQNLISNKTTVSYDNVWNAFKAVDKYLPRYPCSDDLTMIPDIYSDYCWTPEKNV